MSNTINKIFLVGFMGSGKSTLGKKLAKKLNKPFFDLDIEIEKKEGVAIEKIFSNKGEDYFRKIEQKILKEIILKKESFVMALGGGTPCFFDNMQLINNKGVSIYIKHNSGILAHRLLNAKTVRPLIKDKSKDELIHFINHSLLKREPFYIQSKFTIANSNLKVEDIIKCVKNDLQ